MKKLLPFLVLLFSIQAFAQTNPISSITISLPPNPDASIAKWSGGAGVLTITATAKATGGRVDGRVQESKILVSIKKSGGKICGPYTSNSAPASNFNAVTKVWSGSNAVALLGQDCTLPPGDYELCVQFFGAGPAGLVPMSEEKCRSFTIRAEQTYQPPQGIAPANDTELKEEDFKKPITFRWTPVIPRPQEPVIYRLRVWQLMQGQNGPQAIKSSAPDIEKDINNLTQASIVVQLRQPPLSRMVWNIQALDRDGKPLGGNNGTSEAFTTSVTPVNDRPSIITLIAPAKGSAINAGDKPKFSWSPQGASNGAPTFYKIKIVEIKGNQSPEEAMRTNKPHFERDSIPELSFLYTETASLFEGGKNYAWNVQALNRDGKPIGGNNGTSEVFSINVRPVNDPPSILTLIAPVKGSAIKAGDKPKFTWSHQWAPKGAPTFYKIKIIEIKGDQSPEEAMRTNKPHFERDSLRELIFLYSETASPFEGGKKYAWRIEAKRNPPYDQVKITESEINEFVVNNVIKASLSLISPTNGITISAQKKPKFTWTNKFQQPVEPYRYKLVIKEILLNQSPYDAIRGNKPFFERDSLREQSFQYPSFAPQFQSGKNYVWNVQALNRDGKPIGGNNGTSESYTFNITSEAVNNSPLLLIAPADGATIDQLPTFRWATGDVSVPGDYDGDGYYKIRIVEIKGDESPDNAIRGNKPFFERDSIREKQTYYPTSAPPFQSGKTYAWAVASNSLWSNVWVFKPGPDRPSCKDFKVTITKNDKTPNRDACCYDISISNNYKGSNAPTGFRVLVKDFTVVSASDVDKSWERTPAKFPASTSEMKWIKTSADIPAGKTGLGTICLREIKKDPFYLVYEWFDAKGKVICKDSVQLASCGVGGCRNDLIRNGGFVQGASPGPMPTLGAIQHWTNGYGNPTINNDTAEGFIEKGFVKISGNVSSGQAVSQLLNSNNKIIQGKKYKISVAVRFKSNENTTDYVRVRVIAFNGTISSGNGVHPAPSADVAIVGRSGKLKDCGDWAVLELPVWTAGKDFSNIGINAFTNDNTNATVWIDNVTTCESNESGCDDVQTDEKGNPVMPAGYGSVPSGFTCVAEAENDEYLNGSLQDLYPGYDGTSSIYEQSKNDCFSVGGTLPEEATKYSCDDSLRAAGIEMTCDQLQKLLQQDFIPAKTEELSLPPINSISDNKCDRPLPNAASMPFNGRDIIYIHGLQMSHIIDRANGKNGATGQWPANQNEYYTGYYHNEAVFNMIHHINHFLRYRGHKNRFLIVSYDCSQSAELAVYTILTQIREAMQNGRGVFFDSSDKRGRECFGRDYVFISHSTGALVADVALSIANKTKQPGALQTKYGNLGLISDRCKGRLSIQGAYSGSNLAKIACIAAEYPLATSTALTTIAITALMGSPIGPLASLGTLPSTSYLNSILSLIPNSILVDLVPSISHARWGPYINDISVPVFTLAGGHPSAILWNLKYSTLPGFDDGVLTMDCANANKNPISLGPSSFFANPIKVFDMGIPLSRGIKYYLDQRISEGVFAAASTAYLSPTGMVQPVSSIKVESQNHFNNHYSFIQSAKQHWFNATEPSGPATITIFNTDITLPGTAPCDYEITKPQFSVNNEEELVVTNPNLFTPGLIDPSIISQMGETLKDNHISYPWVKVVIRHGIPRLTVYWKKFYIWKRTYHKLFDACMYDADYAYKYLFKQ